MVQMIIDYLKDLFDPSPIKRNRFTMTQAQFEELEKIVENAYEHKHAGT